MMPKLLAFVITFLSLYRLTAGYGIVVSEYLGDPYSLLDAEGEYLELINTSENPLETDSLILFVDEDTLLFLHKTWKPNEIFLICRDSLKMSEFRINCNRDWAELNLVNSSPQSLGIYYGDSLHLTELQKPLRGVSWENSLDSKVKWEEFLPATLTYGTGDKGSPGTLPAYHKLKLKNDLSVDSLSVVTTKQGILFHYSLKNWGSEKSNVCELKWRVDFDWDGRWDNDLDSDTQGPIAPGHSISGEKLFTQSLQPALYQLELCPDGNILNNLKRVALLHPSPLQITEVCPAPEEEESEWFELQNTGPHPIYLHSILYNNIPLISSQEISRFPLMPGDFLVVARDTSAFNSQFVNLGVKSLQPPSWDIMTNTGGDSVLIGSIYGALLDSMHFPSLKSTEKKVCFIRNSIPGGNWVKEIPSSQQESESNKYMSPGYTQNLVPEFTWSLTKEIIDINNSEDEIQINLDSPAGDRSTVVIFDLVGYPVRHLLDKVTGKHFIRWNGRDDKNRLLPVGPYILWMESGGRTRVKKPLILAAPL